MSIQIAVYDYPQNDLKEDLIFHTKHIIPLHTQKEDTEEVYYFLIDTKHFNTLFGIIIFDDESVSQIQIYKRNHTNVWEEDPRWCENISRERLQIITSLFYYI